MIISKQRIISEYRQAFTQHSPSHDFALQKAAQALGIAEQVVADTVSELQSQDAAEFA
ncbi:MAG: hypothetical protein V4488_00320 [Pseudomonadota bacterium]